MAEASKVQRIENRELREAILKMREKIMAMEYGEVILKWGPSHVDLSITEKVRITANEANAIKV